MAYNVIEIKLSDEDRKLLNEITTGLTVFSHLLAKLTEIPAQGFEIEPQELTVDEKATEEANSIPETVTAPEALPWDTRIPAETEPVKAEPSVDLAQIQQRVVMLCALDGGVHKAATRAVINQYGARVSDLKDQPEKWDEVWTKLCEIATEG